MKHPNPVLRTSPHVKQNPSNARRNRALLFALHYPCELTTRLKDDGFPDGGGVRRVVLAVPAKHMVRGDELGGDQLYRVPVLTEQSCPVVRAGASFHADQTGWDLRDKR